MNPKKKQPGSKKKKEKEGIEGEKDSDSKQEEDKGKNKESKNEKQEKSKKEDQPLKSGDSDHQNSKSKENEKESDQQKNNIENNGTLVVSEDLQGEAQNIDEDIELDPRLVKLIDDYKTEHPDKHAFWHGELTHQFLEWKDEKLAVEGEEIDQRETHEELEKKALDQKRENAEETEGKKFRESEVPHGKENKTDFVARNLLRLYKFIRENKKFNERELMAEIDVGTPNEELRNEISALKLEIDALEEENQALRQSALQSQIQHEEQIEMRELEYNEVKNELTTLQKKYKNKIEEMENEVKTELKKREKKYREIINDLRKKLNNALGRSERFSEFADGFEQLQNRMLKVVKDNEYLESTLKKIQREYESLHKGNQQLQKEYDRLETKHSELKKKVDLQKNVIDGYKRKYGMI